MKRLMFILWLAGAAALLAGRASAVPLVEISLVPSTSKIHPPEDLFVDIFVSGLQSGGIDNLLGAWSLDLRYRSDLFVPLLRPPAGFGDRLGNVQAGEAVGHLETSTLDGSGTSSLFLVSLLSDIELRALQTDTQGNPLDGFRLATIGFFAPGDPGFTGLTTSIAPTNIILGDAFGNPIADANGVPIPIRRVPIDILVPEPQTPLLLALGLLGLLVAYRRRVAGGFRRRWQRRHDCGTKSAPAPPLMLPCALALWLVVPRADADVTSISSGRFVGISGKFVSPIGGGTNKTWGEVREERPTGEGFGRFAEELINDGSAIDAQGRGASIQVIAAQDAIAQRDSANIFSGTGSTQIDLYVNQSVGLTATGTALSNAYVMFSVDTRATYSLTGTISADAISDEGNLFFYSSRTRTSLKSTSGDAIFFPAIFSGNENVTQTLNLRGVLQPGSYRFEVETEGEGKVFITDGKLRSKTGRSGFNLQLTVDPLLPPTIDAMRVEALPITYRDGMRIIPLSGIDDGTPGVTEGLTVTASTSNPAVVTTPVVNYQPGNASGTLSYRAVEAASGSSVMTVTVTDDGGTPLDPQDDSSTSVSFTVFVLASKPCSGAPCLVYAGLRDSGEIEVIDAGTNQVVDRVALDQQKALELAMSPDGSRVYVIGFGGGRERVSIVDTATRRELGTVALPGSAQSVAITPDGKQLYLTIPNDASGVDDLVVIIDTETDRIVDVLEIGEQVFPDAIAFSPDGKLAYVTGAGSNSVLVLDTQAHALTNTIPLGPPTGGRGPQHLAITPDGQSVYVSSYDTNSVLVIDTATKLVIAQIPVGELPEGIVISPDGRRAYVATFVSAFSGRIDVIDTSAHRVTHSISLNGRNGPNEIGITPDGTRAYVTHSADRVISLISLATDRVVRTIEIGTPTVGVSLSTPPLLARNLGDTNGDRSVDRNDITSLLAEGNTVANDSACGLACDLDSDGRITVLDARKLALLCTKARCEP